MRNLRGYSEAKGPSHDPDDPTLSPRARSILRTIIDSHVADGDPVGSALVARANSQGLSAASIRNVMADLEERGYLMQPHASAGRVPTERAWRQYADEILRSHRRNAGPRPNDPVEAKINRLLTENQGQIPAMMEEASRLLSNLSRNVGVVVAPDISAVVLERIDFVRMERHRVMAMVVDPAGVVINRMIEIGDDIPQERLDAMAGLLMEQFAGMTLPQARARLVTLMSEDAARRDELFLRSLAVADEWLSGFQPGQTTGVYVGGASRILDQPDFASSTEVRELLAALEEKGRIVELLNSCLEGRGVSVLIGSENEDPRLRHCAILAAPYHADGRKLGTVGIIGPTRMHYAKVITIVESLSRALGQALSSEAPPAHRKNSHPGN